jgi:hypothetical protein
MRGRRGQPRTHRRGVEAFYERVLSWGVADLLGGTREAVGLPPLPAGSDTYASPEHYFAVGEAVAVEEARAVLAEAARRAGALPAGLRVRLGGAPTPVAGGRMEQLDAALLWPCRSEERGARRDLERAEVRTKAPDWRRQGTVLLLRAPAPARAERGARGAANNGRAGGADPAAARRPPGGPGVLAVVAPSRAAADSEEVPLWVEKRHRAAGWEAEVVVLESLISLQRMAVACFVRPRVPFMHQLLGCRPAKHTPPPPLPPVRTGHASSLLPY